MSSEFILILNFLLYTFVFLFFFYQDQKRITIKNFVFLCLSVVSLSSYLFYIQPGFPYTVHYSVMSISPFIYLFIAFMCLMLPYRCLKDTKKSILLISHKKLHLIILYSVPFLFILFIIELVLLMQTNLGNMGDLRDSLYNNEINLGILSSNWLFAIILRLYNMTFVLLYSLSFYALVFMRKNFIVWSFIILPYVITLEYALLTATRASLFFMILFMFFEMLLYIKYMNRKQKIAIKYTFGVISCVLILFILFMTTSRFQGAAQLYMYKYAGESMINFNGLLFDHIKGSTGGQAYFSYILEKIGMGGTVFHLNEKWIFIENVTGVSGQFFYTIIGAFIFEFGKKNTLIICFVLGYVLFRIFRKPFDGKQFIILSFITYQLIAGLFLFTLQGDQGNMSLIIFLIFCFWMKPSRRYALIENGDVIKRGEK